MKNIIIKIGGAVISDKQTKNFPSSREQIAIRFSEFAWEEYIDRLAKEFVRAKYEAEEADYVIINGAGPFGHNLVYSREGPELVHQSVEYLNEQLVETFNKHLKERGYFKMSSIAPIDTCFYDGDFDISALQNKINEFLEEGHIPSSYGDLVPTRGVEGKFYKNYEVISGDDLVAKIAASWPATEIYMVTDVDRVFVDTRGSFDIMTAKQITVRKNDTHEIDFGTGSYKTDVTGEMYGKILKVGSLGIPARFINGLKPRMLERALCGEEIGTLVIKK